MKNVLPGNDGCVTEPKAFSIAGTGDDIAATAGMFVLSATKKNCCYCCECNFQFSEKEYIEYSGDTVTISWRRSKTYTIINIINDYMYILYYIHRYLTENLR